MSPAAASNPPSKKERQARRKEKQAQSDSRFQEMTGKSLEQMNDEVIGLMANPLPLGQYRERFPLLLNGAKNPAWDLLLDFMFRKDPPPPVRARLGSSPRDWAIRKPGWFRRLLTLIVDFPALLVLFSIVIKQGPKVCQALGFASNGWGEGIFMLSGFLGGFIGYYVLFELLLGASPGGFLLGLRVVDEYGKPPGIGFLVMRQVWKILDLFFMFLGGAARLNLPPTSHTTLVIPEFLPGEVVIR